MKYIIACDSFKGSCSSEQVAESVEKGILSVVPDAEIVKVAVADGGEGTASTLTNALGGKPIEVKTHDPLMREKTSSYGYMEHSGTAIMEMAESSGLPLISPSERNPLKTTTFGTGEMIADALKRGCRKFIVGIGGSATNDGGMGMMQALGVAFFDKDNNVLGQGGSELSRVARIDTSSILSGLAESNFTIICDVNNPLFGENGAAYIFAPQKGASPNDVEQLDNGLRNYAEALKKELGKDIADIPGSGAAGGMGAAFLAFLPAVLTPGIHCVLDALNFDGLLDGADLVITGEGKIDTQTAMGKVPAGVLEYASRHSIPVIALAGCVEDTETLNDAGFLSVFSIQSAPVSLEKAMKTHYAMKNIERTAAQIMRTMLGKLKIET